MLVGVKMKCFCCGKRLGKNPNIVDTRDDQTVFVGRDCFKLIKAAGKKGYQRSALQPRLYCSISAEAEVNRKEICGEKL